MSDERAFQIFGPVEIPGCSNFEGGLPCGVCEAGRPDKCIRNRDERRLWPEAKANDVCGACGKRYDQHGVDPRFKVVSRCDQKRFALVP
ncbi:hypothetical protein [Sorangium sp. So ce388]|uniref:hypothetical protein n=1 Tax=Sorangium sp. So ce388 TaxID=3133309 RepID=UPI003F5BF297